MLAALWLVLLRPSLRNMKTLLNVLADGVYDYLRFFDIVSSVAGTVLRGSSELRCAFADCNDWQV